jgi:serine/threonine-protein kinase HipA
MTLAQVSLWGRVIGAVSWDAAREVANFEYDAAFAGSGIEVAPLMMPLSRRIYSFPGLSRQTFRGLPGLLSDSLPDDFGNALINSWLARQGRAPDSFNPVERLCYTGSRGMGALEYAPAVGPLEAAATQLDLDALTALAADILRARNGLEGSFAAPAQEHTLNEILRVGTSAGGARAKAIIAWNPQTQEVRSGQIKAGQGFSYWLLKFDGVSGNRDKELDDPEGYGLIEYGYYLMARAAGITIAESRLLKENGRNHFMTKRFDRTDNGGKLHMQTLGAIAHFDYCRPGAYSYEQALQVIRRLGLPMASIEELFRRMVFNILARNQDDHVKNTAFLMQPSGQWALSPAYDLTYSYNPAGAWTGQHQMSLNGKRDKFEFEDIEACAESCSMKKGRAATILREVLAAVERWPEFAAEAGVAESVARKIQAAHRKL